MPQNYEQEINLVDLLGYIICRRIHGNIAKIWNHRGIENTKGIIGI